MINYRNIGRFLTLCSLIFFVNFGVKNSLYPFWDFFWSTDDEISLYDKSTSGWYENGSQYFLWVEANPELTDDIDLNKKNCEKKAKIKALERVSDYFYLLIKKDKKKEKNRNEWIIEIENLV
jgi:hypothetical protein